MEDWTSRFKEITEADKVETSDDLKDKLADYMAKKGAEITIEAFTLHGTMAAIKGKADANGPSSLTEEEARTLVEGNSRLSHITGMMEVFAEISNKFLKD